MNTPYKKGLALGVKAIITAFLLFTLWQQVDPQSLIATMKSANGTLVGLAGLLAVVNIALNTLLWYLILHHIDPNLRFADALRGVFVGYSMGLVTPAQLGDYVGRIVRLPHSDKWEAGVSILASKVPSMTWSVALGCPTLLYFILLYQPVPASGWWAMSIYTFFLGCFLVSISFFPRFTIKLLGYILPRRRFLRPFLFLRRLSQRRLLLLIAFSLLYYLTFCTQFALLMRAFYPAVSWTVLYGGVFLIYAGKYILPPVTILDLGIREGLAVFFFTALGLSAAAALNASLLIYLLNMVIPAFLGIPLIWGRTNLENGRGSSNV